MVRMTLWRGVVWNAACDTKTGITAGTHAELMARIEAGQAAGHLGGIYEVWEEQGVDPDTRKREEAELRRIRLTSCPMPPESDLLLVSQAKAMPSHRWEEIDPDRGEWLDTRRRLARIRDEKLNEHIRAGWPGQT